MYFHMGEENPWHSELFILESSKAIDHLFFHPSNVGWSRISQTWQKLSHYPVPNMRTLMSLEVTDCWMMLIIKTNYVFSPSSSSYSILVWFCPATRIGIDHQSWYPGTGEPFDEGLGICVYNFPRFWGGRVVWTLGLGICVYNFPRFWRGRTSPWTKCALSVSCHGGTGMKFSAVHCSIRRNNSFEILYCYHFQ